MSEVEVFRARSVWTNRRVLLHASGELGLIRKIRIGETITMKPCIILTVEYLRGAAVDDNDGGWRE